MPGTQRPPRPPSKTPTTTSNWPSTSAGSASSSPRTPITPTPTTPGATVGHGAPTSSSSSSTPTQASARPPPPPSRGSTSTATAAPIPIPPPRRQSLSASNANANLTTTTSHYAQGHASSGSSTSSVGPGGPGDPLTKLTLPPPNESPESRVRRIQAEQDAARVSAEIDASLLEDARREEWRKKALKILLLGQAQSGKSTILKNFQLLASPKCFEHERRVWKAVIQINLIQSITRLWETIDARLVVLNQRRLVALAASNKLPASSSLNRTSSIGAASSLSMTTSSTPPSSYSSHSHSPTAGRPTTSPTTRLINPSFPPHSAQSQSQSQSQSSQTSRDNTNLAQPITLSPALIHLRLKLSPLPQCLPALKRFVGLMTVEDRDPTAGLPAWARSQVNGSGGSGVAGGGKDGPGGRRLKPRTRAQRVRSQSLPGAGGGAGSSVAGSSSGGGGGMTNGRHHHPHHHGGTGTGTSGGGTGSRSGTAEGVPDDPPDEMDEEEEPWILATSGSRSQSPTSPTQTYGGGHSPLSLAIPSPTNGVQHSHHHGYGETSPTSPSQNGHGEVDVDALFPPSSPSSPTSAPPFSLSSPSNPSSSSNPSNTAEFLSPHNLKIPPGPTSAPILSGGLAGLGGMGGMGGDDPLTKSTSVLNACLEDILALWGSGEVDRLLGGGGANGGEGNGKEKEKEKEVKGKGKWRLAMDSKSGAGWFLPDAERICARGWEPSDEDILRARLRTLGVREHILRGPRPTGSMLGKEDWIIYDVGGDKSQRPTWTPYFEHVNAIIFLAPISTFDEYLEEDGRTNRLVDSLSLWRQICNSPLLSRVALVLFFNKRDVLEWKISNGARVEKFFPSFGDWCEEKGYTSGGSSSGKDGGKDKERSKDKGKGKEKSRGNGGGGGDEKDMAEEEVGVARSDMAKLFVTYMRAIFRNEMVKSGIKRPFLCHESSAINHTMTAKIIGSVRDSILREQLHVAGVL